MIYLSSIFEEFAGSLCWSQHLNIANGETQIKSSRFRTWLVSCLAPQLVLIGNGSLPLVSLSPSEICHWLVEWKIKLFDTSRAPLMDYIHPRVNEYGWFTWKISPKGKGENIDPFATKFCVFRPWVSRNSWIRYTNFGYTSKSSPKFHESCETQDVSFLTDTRWAPASDKWGDKPYKWPYKWVSEAITLLTEVTTPFITDSIAHLAGYPSRSMWIWNWQY